MACAVPNPGRGFRLPRRSRGGRHFRPPARPLWNKIAPRGNAGGRAVRAAPGAAVAIATNAANVNVLANTCAKSVCLRPALGEHVFAGCDDSLELEAVV